MSELTLAQLGVMKAVVARDRSRAGLIAKGLIDYVDLLLTDRKALVRYVMALRALQKSLRDHGMDVSVAENNAVWNEVVEAYEELSRELRDEISEDV